MTDLRADLIEAAAQLTDVLDAESSALTKGDFDMVANLGLDKAPLVDRIERAGMGIDPEPARNDANLRAALERLDRARRRNVALHESVRRGFDQAQARITGIARRNAEVGVYGADGGKVQFDGAGALGRGRTA